MNHYTKNILFQATLLSTMLLTISCGNNKKADDSKIVAEERNDEMFENDEQESDAQFMVSAAEINLEEIRLGQLAQQHGHHAHVRELGKMMEDAHTKSFNDLKVLAGTKRIAVPTSPTDDVQEAYKELSESSGIDFDKAYADKMVEAHEDAIEKFEHALENSEDPEIQKLASDALPGLRAHLQHSLECQRKCEKI